MSTRDMYILTFVWTWYRVLKHDCLKNLQSFIELPMLHEIVLSFKSRCKCWLNLVWFYILIYIQLLHNHYTLFYIRIVHKVNVRITITYSRLFRKFSFLQSPAFHLDLEFYYTLDITKFLIFSRNFNIHTAISYYTMLK